jgi:hypothetical protein
MLTQNAIALLQDLIRLESFSGLKIEPRQELKNGFQATKFLFRERTTTSGLQIITLIFKNPLFF